MDQIINLPLNELTVYRYRYLANTILNAGFLQFDNQFTEKLAGSMGIKGRKL